MSDPQYKVARKGDAIWHEPIVTGSVIEGTDYHTTSPGNKFVAYVGASVVCSIHPGPNWITTGAKNTIETPNGPAHTATYGSQCKCGATVIAASDNTDAEGNSYS